MSDRSLSTEFPGAGTTRFRTHMRAYHTAKSGQIRGGCNDRNISLQRAGGGWRPHHQGENRPRDHTANPRQVGGHLVRACGTRPVSSHAGYSYMGSSSCSLRARVAGINVGAVRFLFRTKSIRVNTNKWWLPLAGNQETLVEEKRWS